MLSNPNPNSSRRILIVDDDPLIVSAIASVLHSGGYLTAEASSSEEARQLAHDFMPDLVIIDRMMKDMSGLELARYFQNSTNIHIMFITAQPDADTMMQAAQYGAAGSLHKPFVLAQFVPLFETALSRADEIRQLRQEDQAMISSLNAGRDVGMAVGLLMARFQSDRDTAFEVLRSYSRNRRCKITVVVQQLMEAEELLNSFKTLFAKSELKADSSFRSDK